MIVRNKERTNAFPDIPIQFYRGMFALQAEYDETTRRPHQNQLGFDDGLLCWCVILTLFIDKRGELWLTLRSDPLQDCGIFELTVLGKEHHFGKNFHRLGILVHERQIKSTTMLAVYRNNGDLRATFLAHQAGTKVHRVVSQRAFDVT